MYNIQVTENDNSINNNFNLIHILLIHNLVAFKEIVVQVPYMIFLSSDVSSFTRFKAYTKKICFVLLSADVAEITEATSGILFSIQP